MLLAVFHVGLVVKPPGHPLYGVGDPDCFSIDGMTGGNISVVAGSSYGFQAMGLPTDYSIYISTSDVGAGAGQLSPYAAGDDSLLWTVALPPGQLSEGNVSPARVSHANSSSAGKSSGASNSSGITVQFMSVFGVARLSGRLQIQQLPANRTESRQEQTSRTPSMPRLSVEALSLSSTMATESEPQPGSASSTAIRTLSDGRPMTGQCRTRPTS